MSARQPTIGFPIGVRVRIWVRRLLPVLGFAASLAGILVLLQMSAAPGQWIGLATEVDVPVSSGVAGRLTSVLVTIHQDVEAGAVIATLDDSDARLEVDAEVLGIAELRAQLDAARERLRTDAESRTSDLLDLRRRLELDRLDARLGLVEEQARQDSDTAALRGLASELKVASALAGDSLSMRRLDTARADHDALAARIQGRISTLESWRQAEESAAERLRLLPTPSVESHDILLEPLSAAIASAEKRLERARFAVEQRVVRTPIAGRVAAILQRPGEETLVDQPVVLVSSASSSSIVTWIKEDEIWLARVGAEIDVRRPSVPSIVGRGEIESLGPAVVEVPPHALRDPAVREFGLPVMLRAPTSFALVPGERVQVRLVR